MGLDSAITSLSWNKGLRVPPRHSLLSQLALYITPLFTLNSENWNLLQQGPTFK